MESPKEYDDTKSSNPSISSFYDTFARDLIENMSWRDGDVIMDYGCGSGQFATRYLTGVANSVKVLGVDVSPSMIDFARIQYEEKLLAKFFIGNIMDPSNWKFENGSIDKLISYLVLMYIPDYTLWFDKVFELLKPGGQMGLLVPFSKAYGIPGELLDAPKWKGQHQDAGIKMAKWAYEIENGIPDFMKSLVSTGFEVLLYEIVDLSLEFEDIDKLCEFLSLVTTLSSRIPKESQESFMQDMASFAAKRLEISFEHGVAVTQDWKFVKIVAQK